MYEFEKYAAQPENVMDVLEQYGVAIIPSILSESECDAMQRGVKDATMCLQLGTSHACSLGCTCACFLRSVSAAVT